MRARPVETALQSAFDEQDAQAVVFVRAVEESDVKGRWLPLAERSRATLAARRVDQDQDQGVTVGLAARARDLLGFLEENTPHLRRWLRWTRPGRGWLAVCALLAGLAGMTLDALGSGRRVHLLAVPLLGVLAWNTASLVLLVLRQRLMSSGHANVLSALIEGWFRRFGGTTVAGGEDKRALLRAIWLRYLDDWLSVVAPLAAARLRRILHAVALCFAGGVVAGMYLRGLVFEFRATWESTFLSAAAVDAFLGVLLGPAAWLTGLAIPPAGPIHSPEGGDAAVWIHLYAVTTGLVVGVPRSVLLAVEWARCSRLAGHLRVNIGRVYLRRMLASIEPGTPRVAVLPYATGVSSHGRAALSELFSSLLGARCEVRVADPVDYGAEPEETPLPDAAGLVLLFGLAQTPETELHGAFAAGISDRLEEETAFLVLVDEGGYARRLAGTPEAARRLSERRQAWDRALEGTALRPVHLRLGEPLSSETLAQVLEKVAGALGAEVRWSA